MKLTVFNENDSILLLGEGNFSFSVALSRLNLKINITSTCYEDNISQDIGKKNIECLKDSGVRVLLGVDATKLQEHAILKTELFDKIMFNFPHVGGKMRIEKNRELLRKFFINATKLLRNNGQVLVTLCNGQGGTFFDNPPRRWDDSWKITEMAAYGDFVLAAVEPFMWSFFQNYIVTGYRSLEKQFHCIRALTHIFVKSEPPKAENIAPKNKINVFQCVNDTFSWEDIIQMISTSNINTLHTCAHTYTYDITFSISKKFDTTTFYVLLYNHAGCIIDSVNFVRSYETPDPKRVKKTYRISYKSVCLPLYRKRVIDIHQNVIANILENNLNVLVSR